MLDERKSDVYQLLPSRYVPKTILLKAGDQPSIDDIETKLDFPLICKPDIGYKGHKVLKIDNRAELRNIIHHDRQGDLLLQEFLTEQREFSIMYYRLSRTGESGVTSFVEKHMPTITGDGHSTIDELIIALNNPFIDTEWIFKKLGPKRNDILEKGEQLTVDHIGNYSRGSKFENLSDQIDGVLRATMDSFFDNVTGINFARVDLKSDSLEALKDGKFRVLEINGAKSEPIHIYDSKMTWWRIIRDISFHWNTLFRIVKDNIANVDHPSSIEGLKSYRKLKRIMDL